MIDTQLLDFKDVSIGSKRLSTVCISLLPISLMFPVFNFRSLPGMYRRCVMYGTVYTEW